MNRPLITSLALAAAFACGTGSSIAGPAPMRCINLTNAAPKVQNRAHGLRYEITSVCAADTVGGTKEYTTPTQAQRGGFLLVTARIENVTNEPLLWIPQKTVLIDDDRNLYEFSTTAAAALLMEDRPNAPDMFSITAQPGLVRTMTLPFDVPATATKFRFYLTQEDAGRRSGGVVLDVP